MPLFVKKTDVKRKNPTRSGKKWKQKKKKLQSVIIVDVINLSQGTQLRGKIDEGIFFAGNCETSHGMIESKLFLSSI